jgi:hypothetical protein
MRCDCNRNTWSVPTRPRLRNWVQHSRHTKSGLTPPVVEQTWHVPVGCCFRQCRQAEHSHWWMRVTPQAWQSWQEATVCGACR